MSELQHIEQTIERLTRAAWYETGIQYARIHDEKLFRQGEWLTWADYCPSRWNRAARSIDEQIQMAKEIAKIGEMSLISAEQFPSSMSHAKELVKLDNAEDRAQVWRRVLASSNGTGITAQIVRGEVERYKAEKSKNWITLDEWTERDVAEQVRILTQGYGTGKSFNQTNDNIEWARWSWNPVTGCLHNCAYCYARDIANRFYPQLFQPSIVPDRLSAPANTKQPRLDKIADPTERMGQRSVFVCSMADLFGKWVPSEWIDVVLQQAWDNPQWNFLFLTKFPIRMAEFEYPVNTWIGTTVDSQHAVERAEKAFSKIRAGGYGGVAWLSCEPMMERLTFDSLDMFDWVVMGGSSKSTQTPEFFPPFDWIVHLYSQARSHSIPVYMKTNLGIEQRVREYPHETH
jgi:protein gp37